MTKQSCHEAHARKACLTNTARFLERILVQRREEESKQPRFKVAWLVGMQSTSVMALRQHWQELWSWYVA